MASFSELKVFQEEEKSLIALMSRFSDQLTRLKVEELALVSMVRRETEELECDTDNRSVESVLSTEERNEQEDLDLNVQDPFSFALQQLEEEEEEEDSDGSNEVDDLNSFLKELTAKHNKT